MFCVLSCCGSDQKRPLVERDFLRAKEVNMISIISLISERKENREGGGVGRWALAGHADVVDEVVGSIVTLGVYQCGPGLFLCLF